MFRISCLTLKQNPFNGNFNQTSYDKTHEFLHFNWPKEIHDSNLNAYKVYYSCFLMVLFSIGDNE